MHREHNCFSSVCIYYFFSWISLSKSIYYCNAQNTLFDSFFPSMIRAFTPSFLLMNWSSDDTFDSRRDVKKALTDLVLLLSILCSILNYSLSIVTDEILYIIASYNYKALNRRGKYCAKQANKNRGSRSGPRLWKGVATLASSRFPVNIFARTMSNIQRKILINSEFRAKVALLLLQFACVTLWL